VPVRLTSERLGCARVEMVALGASHSLAVTDAPCNNLWGWGWGSCGQLGIGTRYKFSKVKAPSGF
jgi:alpha-tubulin suppressor-like RCC1 family protein